MKTLTLAFLCAVCALTVSAQPSNFEEIRKEVRAMKPRYFTAEYDKFKEITELTGSVPSTISRCLISRSVTGDLSYGLYVWRSGNGQWTSAREAIFLTDGERLKLKGGSRYHNNISTKIVLGRLSDRGTETLYFEITLEEWKQIFSAQKVEFQIGSTEHKFETRYGKGCLALADFAARLKD